MSYRVSFLRLVPLLASSLVPIGLVVVPPNVSEAAPSSTWTASVGGTLASDHVFRTLTYAGTTYGDSYGPGLTPFVSCRRQLNSYWALFSRIGHQAHSENVPLLFTARDFIPSTRARLAGRIVPLALGVRFATALGRAERKGVFVEAAPALVWSRWEERMTSPDREDSFSVTLPGVVLGAGFALPLTSRTALEVGMSYTHSKDLGFRRLGAASEGEFRGLRQWGTMVALSWAR